MDRIIVADDNHDLRGLIVDPRVTGHDRCCARQAIRHGAVSASHSPASVSAHFSCRKSKPPSMVGLTI